MYRLVYTSITCRFVAGISTICRTLRVKVLSVLHRVSLVVYVLTYETLARLARQLLERSLSTLHQREAGLQLSDVCRRSLGNFGRRLACFELHTIASARDIAPPPVST